MSYKRISLYRRILFLLICTLFLTTTFLTFSYQHKKLNHEFDGLVSNNLIAYTQGQRRQTHGIISDVKGTLTSIAVMIETSALSPDDAWLDIYLDALSTHSEMYQIDYLSIDQIQDEAKNSTGTDALAYERLASGNSVVSDIRYSKRLGNKYYFAVAEPVIIDGAVVGALRTRVDASLLTTSFQESSLFQTIHSFIVRSDGTVVYSSSGIETDNNLFTSLKNSGVDDESLNKLKLQLNKNVSFSFQFSDKERSYFLAMDVIRYNDWHLINFVLSPDVLLQSESILQYVIMTGLALILLTAFFGLFMGIFLFRQKQLLNLEQERYAMLAQFSDTILFEYRKNRDVVEFTPNAKKLLYLTDLKLSHLSSDQHSLQFLHPDDHEALRLMLFEVPKDKPDQLQHTELRMMAVDGSYHWFSCQYKDILDSDGTISMVIGKIVDITDQHQREKNLLEQAQTDILTGTYNKSGEQLISRLLFNGCPGFFYMVDLDNFKKVNDTCGHAAGDIILTQLGKLLRNNFSSNDIIARVGGDEFVIFSTQILDAQAAAQKAENLLSAICSLTPGQSDVCLSASIGIAFCPADGTTYHELYICADKAMYAIKQSTKCGYAFYNA